MSTTICVSGDSALIVEFAARIDAAVNAQAVALAESVRTLDLSRTTPLEALLFRHEAQKRLK